jgi:hypothetical protein
MSMDGKTFLAAFQVGSRLYPDEVDRRINRGKINLQKNLLELEEEVERAKKEREKTGLKEFNEFKQGFEKLDLNNVNFPTQWKNLVSKHITGISMSPTANAMYKNIKDTVIKSEVYKASEVGTADVARAVQHWNQNNLEKITDIANLPDDIRQSVVKSHKDFLREEKKTELRDELTLRDEVTREGDERATFTTFLQETGSSYKPEDFNKPEARNEMRRHNQIKEVNDLAIQAGKDGIPLLKRLKIKEDGSGYENLVPIKAELQEIIDEKKRKRGQAGKSLSEAEGNALAYSERMRFDNRIMDQAEINGVNPRKDLIDGFIANYTQDKSFSIGNALLDEGFQSFKVAADNFIRAVLRKESGAAIAESEYIGAFRDYIPLLGDSQKVVEQKRALRKGITNTMRKISGIPWDDSEFVNAPLQFSAVLGDDGEVEATARQQADKYFNLGYINPGDIIEIETDTGWQPMLVPKQDEPKPKKTP